MANWYTEVKTELNQSDKDLLDQKSIHIIEPLDSENETIWKLPTFESVESLQGMSDTEFNTWFTPEKRLLYFDSVIDY